MSEEKKDMCVVQFCEDEATKKFFGNSVCEYHYELGKH